MTRTLLRCTVLVAALLLVSCSRPPAAGGPNAGKVPASIVAEAAGKAAFVEFYSPT